MKNNELEKLKITCSTAVYVNSYFVFQNKEEISEAKCLKGFEKKKLHMFFKTCGIFQCNSNIYI